MILESALGMQEGSQERRMMRRFDMRLPAFVRLEGADEFQTETQNVSERGVFFYLHRAVGKGTPGALTVTFPPPSTLPHPPPAPLTTPALPIETPTHSS